ncbi:MAG: hypothetical protein V4623_09280 [Pseudomonadota bacterium]
MFEISFHEKTACVTDDAWYDPKAQALHVTLGSIAERTMGIWQMGTNRTKRAQNTPLRTIHIVVPKPNGISLQQHCFTRNPLGRFFSIIGSNKRFLMNQDVEINLSAEIFFVTASKPKQGELKAKASSRILRWPQTKGVLSTPHLCVRLHQRSPYSDNTAIKQQLIALLETLNEITLNAERYATYLNRIQFHFDNFNFTQLTTDERSSLVQTIKEMAWNLGARVQQLRENKKPRAALGQQTRGTLEVSFTEMGDAETRVFRTHWSSQRALVDLIPVAILTHLAADPLPSNRAQNAYQTVEEHGYAAAAQQHSEQGGLPTDWDQTYSAVAERPLFSSGSAVSDVPSYADEITSINNSFDPGAFADEVLELADYDVERNEPLTKKGKFEAADA